MRVYWLKTLKKLSIYPLGNPPSAPSEMVRVQNGLRQPYGDTRARRLRDETRRAD